MVENSQLIKTKNIIDSEVKCFLDRIKNSNRIWLRETKKADSAFSLFHPANSEFYKSQDGEKSLEWFIRVHLLNGIIQKMLEDRDISYVPFPERNHTIATGESISKSCNKDNSVFEEKYPFEFIIQENGSKSGIRYFPIKVDSAKTMLNQGIVDKIHIVNCKDNQDDLYDESPYFLSKSSSQLNVFYSSLKAFFCKLFSEDEFNLYLKCIRTAVAEANQIVGFHTIPQLTSRNVFDYKISIIDKLITEDYERMSYLLDPEKESKKKTKTKVFKLASEDTAIMLHYYLDQRLVNSLLGKNDFAICFFTSEYLFQTYCEQKNFDYTSIVAGYLKSVEQLVHTILKALMNDEQHNRAILIKRRTINSNNYPESIRNATVKLPIGKGDKYINMLPLDPMYEDYFDTTLNSMCNCLFSYADGWRVSKKSNILHFLQLFSADCRNDHFHKHNITNWDEVTRIRNNTILCLFCLLGGSIYCNESEKSKQTLGIEDDSFDRLYKALCSISPAHKYFILTFPDGETIKVIRLPNQEDESYLEHGYVLSSIKFIKVEDFNTQDYQKIIKDHALEDEINVTRQHMPERVEQYSYRGNIVLNW